MKVVEKSKNFENYPRQTVDKKSSKIFTINKSKQNIDQTRSKWIIIYTQNFNPTRDTVS